MAQAKVLANEEDELLRKITAEPSKAKIKIVTLRPRGKDNSSTPRSRFPMEKSLFDNCHKCKQALSGCIYKEHSVQQSDGSKRSSAYLLTCGHVLCHGCNESCERTFPEAEGMRECCVCGESAAANVLPHYANANLSACQASYCTGEWFGPARHRCYACHVNLCENCVAIHATRFVDHQVVPRPVLLCSRERPYTGCARHQMPVWARCECGEIVCKKCPENYYTNIKGSNIRFKHTTRPLTEVDEQLEEAMGTSINTISHLRAMKRTALMKKTELEDTMDRMSNEVAIHFNHIIIMAIQRCFDVLKGIKRLGGKHYDAIEKHIKSIDRTERQLIVGVEVDERGRCKDAVRVNSVSQYLRNVSYGLCKPAMQQFERIKVFDKNLETMPFEMDLRTPATWHIMESIGRWGEFVSTNAVQFSDSGEEVSNLNYRDLTPMRIFPTAPIAPLIPTKMESGSAHVFKDGMLASEVPHRLHTALEHFTDLYERRFEPDLYMKELTADANIMRELPFQLGIRVPPEARLSKEEVQDRHNYERDIMQRPGMKVMQPKITGGYRRILNLANREVSVKEVVNAYSRTPCVPPLWMGDDHPAEITPRRSDLAGQKARAEAAAKQSAAEAAGPESTERSSDASSLENGNAEAIRQLPSAACSNNDKPKADEAAEAAAAEQKAGEKVIRKGNLVFVKSLAGKATPTPAEVASVSLASSTAPSSAAMPPTPHDRRGGPSILRGRLHPPSAAAASSSQQQQQHHDKMYFRPATTAERAAVGASALSALSASPSPYTGFRPTPRVIRLAPPRSLHRVPITIRDDRLAIQRVRNDAALSDRFAASAQATQRVRPITSQPLRSLMYPPSAAAAASPAAHSGSMLPRNVQRAGPRSNPGPSYQMRDEIKLEEVEGFMVNDSPPMSYGLREALNEGLRKEEESWNVVTSAKEDRRNQQEKEDGEGRKGRKAMLPIEKAFTNMFGADGSIVPEFTNRRRGRPSKDDPTAPSNIIENFRRHTTQWPPKFDEMDEAEIAELQDLIDQLDAASREEEEGEEAGRPAFAGVLIKSELEEEEEAGVLGPSVPLVSPWQQYTRDDREAIKAAALEKIQGARKSAGNGCFVCGIMRAQGGKPREFQCYECIAIGRELTPIGEYEALGISEQLQHFYAISGAIDQEEEYLEEERDEEGKNEKEEKRMVEEKEEPRREMRGRKRKEPISSTASTPRDARKRRNVEEHSVMREEKDQEDEKVVKEEEEEVRTTRRGRQIRVPTKLREAGGACAVMDIVREGTRASRCRKIEEKVEATLKGEEKEEMEEEASRRRRSARH